MPLWCVQNSYRVLVWLLMLCGRLRGDAVRNVDRTAYRLLMHAVNSVGENASFRHGLRLQCKSRYQSACRLKCNVKYAQMPTPNPILSLERGISNAL